MMDNSVKLHFTWKKILWLIVLASFALFSYFSLSKLFSSPSIYGNFDRYLDDKKLQVAGMAVTASSVAAGLSLLPGDALSPIANQLTSMTNWFLFITVIVTLEKYLLPVLGYITFTFFIPIACGLFGIYILSSSSFFKSFAIKLAVFGVSIVLIVPTSVKLSQIIEQTNRDSIDQAMEVLNANTDDQDTDEEDKNWFEKLYDDATEIASDTVETAKTYISSFIDAIAVLVVTTCGIPLLVVSGYSVLAKMIFGIHITPSPKFINWLNNKKN